METAISRFRLWCEVILTGTLALLASPGNLGKGEQPKSASAAKKMQGRRADAATARHPGKSKPAISENLNAYSWPWYCAAENKDRSCPDGRCLLFVAVKDGEGNPVTDVRVKVSAGSEVHKEQETHDRRAVFVLTWDQLPVTENLTVTVSPIPPFGDRAAWSLDLALVPDFANDESAMQGFSLELPDIRRKTPLPYVSILRSLFLHRQTPTNRLFDLQDQIVLQSPSILFSIDCCETYGEDETFVRGFLDFSGGVTSRTGYLGRSRKRKMASLEFALPQPPFLLSSFAADSKKGIGICPLTCQEKQLAPTSPDVNLIARVWKMLKAKPIVAPNLEGTDVPDEFDEVPESEVLRMFPCKPELLSPNAQPADLSGIQVGGFAIEF